MPSLLKFKTLLSLTCLVFMGGCSTTQSPVRPVKVVEKSAAPVTLGVLVPLTGPHKSMGESILKGVQLGLKDYDTPVILKTYDTKGTPDGAYHAAERALKEHVQGMLGPVFAKETREILPLLTKKKLFIFSFSNDKTIVDGNVFAVGLSLEGQINTLLTHVKSQGLKPLGMLIPKNASQPVFQELAKEHNILRWTYNPRSPNLIALGKDLPNMHLKALFIPEKGDKNKLVLEQLNLNPTTKILGLDLWEPHQKAPLGGLFCMPDPRAEKEFETRYKETYGDSPHKLASIGYDALKMSLQGEGRLPTYQELINSPGIRGAYGNTKITSSHTVERPLKIMEITEAGPITLP